ncbi:hypothetical protein [Streptomyces sp. ICBB 8177]|uniref:WXG100 family type VII secretion target n=1 Tax=Streptomyces sp. ICBB 8177 TaxID=563922 RepID=UPI000D67EE49|nr:hypothetical protein [Streptomyces sp. ICBB 8177]PWI42166.1 hypothetical protein CK485_25760 [Streptomyces sp. ICBB 8177]
MADGEFYVDTEGLGEQLPYVQQLAGRFRDVSKTLSDRLDDLGECWGTGPTGQQFYGQYAQPKEQVLDATGQMADVVDSMHDGIQTMAVNLDRMENENIDATRRLSTGDTPPAETRTKTTES